MSDETQEAGPDELALLKQRAKSLGIQHSGNIGVDALREKVNAALNGPAPEPEQLTKREMEKQLREKLHKEEMKLIRCRIYNLNPGKRDLQGEIITVANKYLGTVRKFIPFGDATENGYHIPQIIYNDLKARKFQSIRTKNKNGKIEVDARMVPEYNLEVLPPLTEEELEELAVRQAAVQRLGA